MWWHPAVTWLCCCLQAVEQLLVYLSKCCIHHKFFCHSYSTSTLFFYVLETRSSMATLVTKETVWQRLRLLSAEKYQSIWNVNESHWRYVCQRAPRKMPLQNLLTLFLTMLRINGFCNSICTIKQWHLLGKMKIK